VWCRAVLYYARCGAAALQCAVQCAVQCRALWCAMLCDGAHWCCAAPLHCTVREALVRYSVRSVVRAALHCEVWNSAMRCGAARRCTKHGVVLPCTVRCRAVWCGAVQCYAVLSVVWCCAALCGTVRCAFVSNAVRCS
jgi:hypothetical protein